MKKIGIFYGSTTGTCSTIAESIANGLNVASSDVIDVADNNNVCDDETDCAPNPGSVSTPQSVTARNIIIP